MLRDCKLSTWSSQQQQIERLAVSSGCLLWNSARDAQEKRKALEIRTMPDYLQVTQSSMLNDENVERERGKQSRRLAAHLWNRNPPYHTLIWKEISEMTKIILLKREEMVETILKLKWHLKMIVFRVSSFVLYLNGNSLDISQLLLFSFCVDGEHFHSLTELTLLMIPRDPLRRDSLINESQKEKLRANWLTLTFARKHEIYKLW